MVACCMMRLLFVVGYIWLLAHKQAPVWWNIKQLRLHMQKFRQKSTCKQRSCFYIIICQPKIVHLGIRSMLCGAFIVFLNSNKLDYTNNRAHRSHIHVLTRNEPCQCERIHLLCSYLKLCDDLRTTTRCPAPRSPRPGSHRAGNIMPCIGIHTQQPGDSD